MGVYDEVTCKYPLPWPEITRVFWQSKDTDAQFLDLYEIREDGTLWHEAYEHRFEKKPEAPLGIWLYKDNVRWVQEPFTGELEIHHSIDLPNEPGYTWYSVKFWFRDGVVKDAVFRKSEQRPNVEGKGSV